MADLELRCRCGAVHGVLRGVSPATVNRCVCYCDDCQAFADALDRADVLDAHGGTEIVHASPAMLAFDAPEGLAALRLRPDGAVRWYAPCCGSPLGNTSAEPGTPFVGLVVRGCLDPDAVGAAAGPVRARVQAKFATGDRSTLKADRLPIGMFAHVLPLALRWWWRSDDARSPLRDASGAPRVAPRVLSPEELAAAQAKRLERARAS